MDTIDVNTAKYNDLLHFAKETLALDVPKNIDKPALKELVAQHLGTKVAAEGAAPAAESAVVAKNLRSQRAEPKVRIRIFEHPDHPKRIPVCVNGVRYTIKQGVYVDVPESVVEVLRNARMTKIVQHDDERGRPVNTTREGLQFPFEIVSPGAQPVT